MPPPFTASTLTRADLRTWSRSASRTSASPRPVPPARRTPAKGPNLERARIAAIRLGLSGRWDRVSGRTRRVLAAGLRSLKPPLAPGYYEELEEVLTVADLGPAM